MTFLGFETLHYQTQILTFTGFAVRFPSWRNIQDCLHDAQKCDLTSRIRLSKSTSTQLGVLTFSKTMGLLHLVFHHEGMLP